MGTLHRQSLSKGDWLAVALFPFIALNWRSAAQPARAGRSAGGARRSAPPRARTREIRAIKGNAAPFLLMFQSRVARARASAPQFSAVSIGVVSKSTPYLAALARRRRATPSTPAPRRPHQPQPNRHPAPRTPELQRPPLRISQGISRKRTLEKEIGEAPPSRLERVGLLAERVARLRLARAREKFAPLRETPPLFC